MGKWRQLLRSQWSPSNPAGTRRPHKPIKIVIGELSFLCFKKSSPAYFFTNIAEITYGCHFCFRHAQSNRKDRSSILKYKLPLFWVLNVICTKIHKGSRWTFILQIFHFHWTWGIYIAGQLHENKAVFVWFPWDGLRRLCIVATDVSSIWTEGVRVVLHLW